MFISDDELTAGNSLENAKSLPSTSTLQIEEELEFILGPPLNLTSEDLLPSMETAKKSPFSNLPLNIQRHMVKIFTKFH